jgi:membrane fusion protein (multidrug efflux system)
MARAGKGGKRAATDVTVWETQTAVPARRAVPQVAGDRDAIGELLGTSPAPVTRTGGGLSRQLRWALVVVPLLGVAVPLHLWIQYRSGHVTSKNAAVRGHVADIGTRISGRVASVAVDAGDRVKAAQVLVQLEDRRLLAEVSEARAEVTALERTIEAERVTVELERVQVQQQGPEGAARVAAARANAEAARIEAEDARRNHELQQQLHSRDGLVSAETLRGAETQRRAAEARLDEAQANALVAERSAEQRGRLAQDGVTIRRRRIAVLEADLLAARARLTRAETDLESAAIRAPEDGAIVRRVVQPGVAVEAGQPVISMWLGDDLWVEAWIDEEDLGFVRRGGKAVVTFQALPGREFTGVVERIGLATDLEIPESDVPQPRFTRMRDAPVVGVRIRLAEPPPHLVPGLSAVVAIERTS